MSNAYAPASVTTGGTTVAVSPKCSSFMVSVPSSSTYGVNVNIPGLHGASDSVYVAPGQTQIFRYGFDDISSVTLTGVGGTATNVAFGPVARTWR